MTGQATITAASGAGGSVSAASFTGITELRFDYTAEVIFLAHDKGRSEFEFSDISSITFSITEGVTANPTITNA